MLNSFQIETREKRHAPNIDYNTVSEYCNKISLFINVKKYICGKDKETHRLAKRINTN